MAGRNASRSRVATRRKPATRKRALRRYVAGIPDLRRIRAFVAVAEELSFSRAAKRIGISQSPLSRTIALLERDLNVRLFERTKRSVALTPAGNSFLADARRLLAHTSDSIRRAQSPDSNDSRANASTIAYKLSNAHKRVFQEVLKGKSAMDIASTLGISPSTARVHIVAIKKAFEVRSRLQLMALFVVAA